MIYFHFMMKKMYMQIISHSSLLYKNTYKLTLGLVKMSIFELRTPVEIYFQKLYRVWRTVYQAVDRTPSDCGLSAASGFGLSGGQSRLYVLSKAWTIRALTQTVRERLFSQPRQTIDIHSLLPHELSPLG
jgi:hypothetical protein